MDLITHAVVGAATGATVGHPWIGMAGGVLPDLVLGFKRRATPPWAYRFTHAPILGVAWFIAVALCWAPQAYMPHVAALLLGWISHILLDIPTHGPVWGPRWFTSSKKAIYTKGTEWEWLNLSWFQGVLISWIWVTLCLVTLA